MISIQKINETKVKAINVPKFSKDKIQGSELFEELYANIFLLAKKKSGKTSTIFTILKKCCNKNTIVLIFASTVNKDANWIAIVKWLNAHKIEVHSYTSIFDNGENQIEGLLYSLGATPEVGSQPKIARSSLSFNDSDSGEDEKAPKKIAPEFFLIFDDLSSEIKNKQISVLLKANRHYKMKVIISSQYFNDLPPDARQQIDYMFLYPNIPEDKIQKVYEELDLSVPYNVFMACYQDSTKDKYNFLYIDVRNDLLRKNFSHQYNINKSLLNI